MVTEVPLWSSRFIAYIAQIEMSVHHENLEGDRRSSGALSPHPYLPVIGPFDDALHHRNVWRTNFTHANLAAGGGIPYGSGFHNLFWR